jgi:hypothetical protein
VVTHCQFGVASTLGDVHLAYDAAGQATSVNLLRHGGRFNTVLGSKVFYTWQSPINAYTALTLNVNSSSNGYTTFSNFGAACIMYSLDNGANWTRSSAMTADVDGHRRPTSSPSPQLRTSRSCASERASMATLAKAFWARAAATTSCSLIFGRTERLQARA